MTDFLRALIDVIAYIWPFRLVWQWESGAYYIFGRYWRGVGPGCWPILPFFMDVRSVNVVADIYPTPLQDITTKDGSLLTFSAKVTFIVTDAAAAMNKVVRHDETATEAAGAVLAEVLADLDAERLTPDRRRGLTKTCVAAINAEIGAYGMEVTHLRFTAFVRNVPTHRLIVSPLTAPVTT